MVSLKTKFDSYSETCEAWRRINYMVYLIKLYKITLKSGDRLPVNEIHDCYHVG